MEFRVLGPLEIADDGRVLALGSGRQLALVALLLVHRNTVVSTERIVDELWEGSPPPTAAKIVRNSVSILRKELGDRLVTRSPGYLLRVEQGELDADRLEQAVADGRSEALSEGLALCGARRSPRLPITTSPAPRSTGWKSSIWPRTRRALTPSSNAAIMLGSSLSSKRSSAPTPCA